MSGGPRIGAPTPFKRFAEPVLGKMLQPAQASPDEVLAPYLKAGHVTWGGLSCLEELPEMWAKPDDIVCLHPVPGDLLVCEGGEVGRATVVEAALPERTIIQNSLHLVHSGKTADPRYLKYALEHVAGSGWLDIVCNKATIAHLTVDKFRELLIPYQVRTDQARIANFLDAQTARIDALIAEKERLLERLAELRYSTISWAVTGGMHQSKGTRKTGNAFVPELPADWNFGGLTKYIGPVIDYRGRTPEKVPEGVLLVTARNIRDGGLDYETSAEFVRPEEYEDIMRRGKPRIGDVLFTMEAPLGQVANVDREDIALAQRIVKFRGIQNILDNYFLKYWLMGDIAQATLSTLATGSTAEGLKASKLGRIPLAVPSQNEQAEIVSFLDERRSAINVAVGHVNEHIARLREYRSSLISAAVTGQIDLGSFKLEAVGG